MTFSDGKLRICYNGPGVTDTAGAAGTAAAVAAALPNLNLSFRLAS